MTTSKNYNDNHYAILWLQDTVDGFRWAYTHNAEFRATIDNQLMLMRVQVELMALGAIEKQRQLDVNVHDAMVRPSASFIVPGSRSLTREDLERARDAGPRFIP